MRIIAGEFRSRRLIFPKTKKTRPMTDRAKETLFGILGEIIFGAQALDLFSGSGSLGLEALSRGAVHVTFVEKAPWGINCIRQNLTNLKLGGRADLIQEDIFPALGKLERQGKTFSVVFLDPPYNQGLVRKILMRLERSVIVTAQTQLILHHSRQENLPETLGRFRVLREKRIGQACLSFLSGGKQLACEGDDE